VTLNPSTGASISPSFLIALWRFPFRTEPVKRWGMNYGMVGRILAAVFLTLGCLQNGYAAKTWQVGTPIVTYWAGPNLTDRVAQQMADGGWNLVWCTEAELDVAARHGLRGQLQNELLTPAALNDPARQEKLDALIQRVKRHPALYSYYITDEPNATNFVALGELVSYLRKRDPAHLAYINLFPTYASNEQLGNVGDKIPAYQEHLQQYVERVGPSLISYDHYQFTTKGDTPDYFLNLALIRQAALDADVPFLNIVQASTWSPVMRVPDAEEMRFLVYTTLAYGAQGISYYVYCWTNHAGGIANPDGTPTALYPVLKLLNRDFAIMATELQPLKSLGVYHAGMFPPGAVAVPADCAFQFDPPLPREEFTPPQPARGALLGVFGKPGKRTSATHAVVVNLDYHSATNIGLRGPGPLEIFNPVSRRWVGSQQERLELKLAPGVGTLIRTRR